jgi:hypothetical protein
MNDEEDHDKKQPPAIPPTTQLTSVNEHIPDGFDEEEPQKQRTVIGSFVKFVEGEWSIGGVPLDPNYRPIVIDIDHGLQHWKDGELVDERFEKPLEDIDELNKQIPQEQWEIFPSGQRKPPWTHAYKFYLLDDVHGGRATYIANTVGAMIAYADLKDRMKWIRRLRGANTWDRVQLTWAPMPTKHSPHPKKRPDLKHVEYVTITGGGFTPLPPTSTPPSLPLGGGAAPPTSAPPTSTPPQTARVSVAQSAQAMSRLQRVEEPSLSEDLNDTIPW